MTEAQLRTVVEEVVKALAAKGFLKAGKCECENGPKALKGDVKTTYGASGKTFGGAADWGAKAAPPAKGALSALPPKPGASDEDDDEHVDHHIIEAAGAARVSVCNPTKKGSSTARYVDHTMLKPNATQDEIAKLCEEARTYCFASVCVNPSYVALSAQYLRGSGVKVCTVVGFPLGSTTPTVKAIEARDAIANGADEIDMVINIGALKSGDLRTVERDIDGVAQPCREAGVISKVIIEAALLTDDEKIAACTLAKAAGADFVKTSTGFGPGGATVADVALMRRIVGGDMGVKAAGGVRDLEGLKAMVAAGASRVGASAGVKIVQQSRGQATTADLQVGGSVPPGFRARTTC
jgi:deoxyribose-phosphate aldolase